MHHYFRKLYKIAHITTLTVTAYKNDLTQKKKEEKTHPVATTINQLGFLTVLSAQEHFFTPLHGGHH